MGVIGSYADRSNTYSYKDVRGVLQVPRQLVQYPDLLGRDCILGELYRVEVRAAAKDVVAFAIPDELNNIWQRAGLKNNFADYWTKKP
jgi:hypothetical protein